MKVKVTIELSDEELRVLREIVLYCGDNKTGRKIPVTTLYNNYNVNGITISSLVNEALIEGGTARILPGDMLREHDIRPTDLGCKVARATSEDTTASE